MITQHTTLTTVLLWAGFPSLSTLPCEHVRHIHPNGVSCCTFTWLYCQHKSREKRVDQRYTARLPKIKTVIRPLHDMGGGGGRDSDPRAAPIVCVYHQFLWGSMGGKCRKIVLITSSPNTRINPSDRRCRQLRTAAQGVNDSSDAVRKEGQDDISHPTRLFSC